MTEIKPPEAGKPWTTEDRVKWLEVKLLHAQGTLQQIASLRIGNPLASVPEGWSPQGHAAAEGLALGFLQGMPDGLRGVQSITVLKDDEGHAHPVYGGG